MQESPLMKVLHYRSVAASSLWAPTSKWIRHVDTMLKEIEHDLLPAIAADLFPGK